MSTASGRSPTSASTKATSSQPTSPATAARELRGRPRVTYTDPQAAAVGALEAPYSGTTLVSEVPKTATYTHAWAQSNGFMTLLSDGQRLTGAYALGPEAGEWMQQATLAIRAQVPLDVLADTIQPFPSFSGIYDTAVMELRMQIENKPRPVAPMNPQMASMTA